MSKKIAIEVKHVSKNFRLPHQKTTTVKKTFVNLLTMWRSQQSVGTQHALKDISFKLEQGEFFGIVGRNGSGKSTLLKILAGIYQPNAGEVTIDGRLVPFIELGVGFNPELTGRDNVYLNGALLGFSRTEVDAMYDDVVEFAELSQFMDQKLKNYSSGMEVRLAFSLATRAKADILLVDEVLAVGDADFQRKCYNFFRQLKKTGVTVVFVTHDMSAVREYCDRAVLIENSRLVAEGSADEVATAYTRLFSGEVETENTPENHAGEDRWGDERVQFDPPTIKQQGKGRQEELVITTAAHINASIEHPVFGFGIKNAAGTPVLGTNTQIRRHRMPALNSGDTIDIVWTVANLLADGDHVLSLTAHDSDGVQVFDWWEDAASLRIRKDERTAYPITPFVEVETSITKRAQ
ncbi:MAG TPA: ABC transporter ATP-binding protein [Candidatus Saccharimonadia bacterium]|nr:ABC transporter ATP-binding protein [Candidatus Saccharimonadia bacterium]